ncbi:MAG: hypothetical protein ABI612_09990 [Betaproteobacteria bacterium]
MVLSPGAPLLGMGAGTEQDRSCTGDSNMVRCQQTAVCTSSLTALCNPANYLDRVDAVAVPLLAALPGSAEDNANFTDSLLPLTTDDGFIAGPVRDGAGKAVANDVLIVLRYSDVMPQLEHRVAVEALNCLSTYALANGTRYPWTANPGNYASTPNKHFGHLPDAPFNTSGAIGTMDDTWEAACTINPSSGWWLNWKDQVYYALAQDFGPDGPAATCASCLTVNSPSAADKRVVIIVAGRRFLSQSAPYLEGANAAGSTVFTQAQASSTFDDVVVYQ